MIDLPLLTSGPSLAEDQLASELIRVPPHVDWPKSEPGVDPRRDSQVE